MTRLGWWWRRHQARHHEWLAYCRWFNDPNLGNDRALERARKQTDRVEAARP